MFEHLYPSLIFVCVLTSEENDNKKQYPSNYFKNSKICGGSLLDAKRNYFFVPHDFLFDRLPIPINVRHL